MKSKNNSNTQTICSYPRFISFKIPDDWKYSSLGKITDLIRGISYKTSDINRDGKGSFFVNLNCFKEEGGFIDKGIIFLFLESKNYKEISDTLGISEVNARVRMNRIKTKLKTQLNA